MTKSIPKQIAIEVTTRCQLRCKNCMKTLGYPDMDMDLDYYKTIIDRNNFGATIIPYQNGEPLLHPYITEMVEYPLSKKMRLYITTNGMIWNEDLFQLITEENGCYQLLFSLDGLPLKKSRSIERARPGSNRELIMKNIIKFLELKAEKKSDIDTCIKLCRRGQDWEEIEEFIYYWLIRGVDYVCIGEMLNQTGTGMRIYPCQYFDDMYMLIRADKEIINCMYRYEVAIENQFAIGKLDEKEDLIEVYNRSKLVKLREDQKKGIFHGACKTCGSAYTGRGFRGQLEFNNPKLKDIGILFCSQDYYNRTFSLVNKKIGINYGNV